MTSVVGFGSAVGWAGEILEPWTNPLIFIILYGV